MALVAEGQLSNLGRDIEVTSEAVMEHMAQRLSFVDPGFDMEVYTDKQLQVRPRCTGVTSCVDPPPGLNRAAQGNTLIPLP